MKPRYFLKEDNILYRRKDGDERMLPDQVLWPSGWAPLCGPAATSTKTPLKGRADPSLLTEITTISESEAKKIARANGLPTREW